MQGPPGQWTDETAELRVENEQLRKALEQVVALRWDYEEMVDVARNALKRSKGPSTRR